MRPSALIGGSILEANINKIGVIACSGEEIAAGTISRLATRRVLEALRPKNTVTLCLPLFLAGEEGERRFARQHPTITVDGCDKLCAKRGTEAHSGQVSASLVVTDILGERLAVCRRSGREPSKANEEAVWIVAERIVAEVDALLAAGSGAQASEAPAAGATCCSCGSPPPEGTLQVNGESVTIHGLPLIFEHLASKGLEPDDRCGDTLLKTVRIYHCIDAADEAAYRSPLINAYRAFCISRGRQ
jgi:uncharacterized metal-binding protein